MILSNVKNNLKKQPPPKPTHSSVLGYKYYLLWPTCPPHSCEYLLPAVLDVSARGTPVVYYLMFECSQPLMFLKVNYSAVDF